MSFPRPDYATNFSVATWPVSFWFDPANAVASPAAGVFQVADRKAGSSAVMTQPTGYTAVSVDKGPGYFRGRKSIAFESLSGLGATDNSQASSYQYLDSGSGVLPTGSNADFAVAMIVHPNSPVCDLCSDGQNATNDQGFVARIVNGQIRGKLGFSGVNAFTLDTTRGTALTNLTLAILIRRASGVPSIECLIEDETDWRAYTHGSALNTALGSVFRLGKTANAYMAGGYNPFGRFGTCMAFNSSLTTNQVSDIKQFLQYQAGFLQ
jgi:hypothetical protein